MQAVVDDAIRMTVETAETARAAINRSGGDPATIKRKKKLLKRREKVLEMLRDAQKLRAYYNDEYARASYTLGLYQRDGLCTTHFDLPSNHSGMKHFVVKTATAMIDGAIPLHLRPILDGKISMLKEHLTEINRSIEAVNQELENNRHVYVAAAERVYERLTEGVPNANGEEDDDDDDDDDDGYESWATEEDVGGDDDMLDKW